MKKLVLLLSLFCTLAHAEVLFGVHYSATLGMVKEVYPNATYTKLKPAWLGSDEAFIRVSGYGMSGTLFVAFNDFRAFWASRTKESATAFLKQAGRQATDEEVETYLARANANAAEADEDALNVKWVRWAPEKPIPLGKLEGRYGKAVCSVDASFDTVCEWPKRSLSATMTEDGKSAMLLDTGFTESERSDGVRKFISR